MANLEYSNSKTMTICKEYRKKGSEMPFISCDSNNGKKNMEKTR